MMRVCPLLVVLVLFASACSDDAKPGDAGADVAPAADLHRPDVESDIPTKERCNIGADPSGKLGYSALYNLGDQSDLCPCDVPKLPAACSEEGLSCFYVQAYCPDNVMGPEYEFEHGEYKCIGGAWDYIGQDCYDCCRPPLGDAGVDS